jgi:hypothetical protein
VGSIPSMGTTLNRHLSLRPTDHPPPSLGKYFSNQ